MLTRGLWAYKADECVEGEGGGRRGGEVGGRVGEVGREGKGGEGDGGRVRIKVFFCFFLCFLL